MLLVLSRSAPATVRRPLDRRRRGAFACLATLALFMIAVSHASAQQQGGSAVAAAANLLYIGVNDPRPNMNSVLGFRIGPDGSLALLPGNPFLTRGTGTANTALLPAPTEADQSILVTPDGQRLFAVNPGSNTFAAFEIQDNGSLVHIPGSPFRSGGLNPVSLGRSNGRLVVVNRNLDPAQDGSLSRPNYFILPDYTLLGEPGFGPRPRTLRAERGAVPSQALISPNGLVLFDTHLQGATLQSFRIEGSGQLLQSPGSPQKLSSSIPPTARPLGLQVHPSQPVLYVGLGTANKVGVYTYDQNTGALTFVTAVNSSGIEPCWMAIDRSGTRLYSVNAGDNSVSVYNITQPTAPVQIQHLRLLGPGRPCQQALDPNGRFLYILSHRATPNPNDLTGNGVHILNVWPDGSVSESPLSPMALPIPAFARPQGIVAL
jgi:6-phosphogluconolactonase (cycloisomerase 2 family)